MSPHIGAERFGLSDDQQHAPAALMFYPGDYHRDTAHLRVEEHGAYLLILMAMWAAGGWLPYEPRVLARIAKVTPRRWGKLAPVLLPFFYRDGERLTQKRLANELRKFREISHKRAASAKLAAADKALRNRQYGMNLGSAKGQQKGGNPYPHIESPESDLRAKARQRGEPIPLSAELRAMLFGDAS